MRLFGVAFAGIGFDGFELSGVQGSRAGAGSRCRRAGDHDRRWRRGDGHHRRWLDAGLELRRDAAAVGECGGDLPAVGAIKRLDHLGKFIQRLGGFGQALRGGAHQIGISQRQGFHRAIAVPVYDAEHILGAHFAAIRGGFQPAHGFGFFGGLEQQDAQIGLRGQMALHGRAAIPVAGGGLLERDAAAEFIGLAHVEHGIGIAILRERLPHRDGGIPLAGAPQFNALAHRWRRRRGAGGCGGHGAAGAALLALLLAGGERRIADHQGQHQQCANCLQTRQTTSPPLIVMRTMPAVGTPSNGVLPAP